LLLVSPSDITCNSWANLITSLLRTGLGSDPILVICKPAASLDAPTFSPYSLLSPWQQWSGWTLRQDLSGLLSKSILVLTSFSTEILQWPSLPRVAWGIHHLCDSHTLPLGDPPQWHRLSCYLWNC
jgi:hypothetical protein